ncbi:MAG: hypothetical protein ACLP7O_09650 [Terracidiphilus sp.]
MKQEKKPIKAGLPPVPEKSAKTGTLRIRITLDELLAIEMAAKANNQTVSEWIRGKLAATIGA